MTPGSLGGASWERWASTSGELTRRGGRLTAATGRSHAHGQTRSKPSAGGLLSDLAPAEWTDQAATHAVVVLLVGLPFGQAALTARISRRGRVGPAVRSPLC